MAKVSLSYRKDGRLNGCTLNLKKEFITTLELNEKDRDIIFKYINKEISLEKGRSDFEEEIKNTKGEIVSLVKNHFIKFDKAGKSKPTKLSIPLPVVFDMGINENDKEVEIENDLVNRNVRIRKIIIEHEGDIMENNITERGIVATIKVNKGGIGKTFITTQLGHGLALKGYKVLLLTSDSQNNIFHYTAFKTKKRNPLFSEGLKAWVKNGTGDLFELRENLEFIPLENNTFSSQFLMKLPEVIEKFREKYDFILIDSIPTMKIDTVFVKSSDKVIIPCFADRVTVDGVINVLKETGVEKVLGIVLNRYENKRIQNMLLKELKKVVEGRELIFPEPIKNSSEIENLLYLGKTIWESNSSSEALKTAKNSMEEIMESLIKLKNREEIEEEFDEFDF